MALPLTETDKFLLLSAVGAPETRDRIAALLDLAGTGNMTGPASATDNALVRFDGTTGALAQNSGVLVSDANAITGVASLNGVTSTELSYVTGVTSAIQTQINTKAATASPTFSGQVLIANTAGPQLILQDGGTAGSNANPFLTFKDGTQDMGYVGYILEDLNLRVQNTEAGPITFYTSNTEYASISAAGVFTFVGPARHADGSEGTPSISFSSGSTNGLYHTGATSFAASANGTAQQRWSSTGISIRGTSTDPLFVKGLVGDSNGMKIFQNGSDSIIRNGANASLFLGANDLNFVEISNAGLVTIGTGTATTHRINSQLATAAADVLTFTNGPTGTAGNPDVYLQININGTNYAIPAFAV